MGTSKKRHGAMLMGTRDEQKTYGKRQFEMKCQMRRANAMGRLDRAIQVLKKNCLRLKRRAGINSN